MTVQTIDAFFKNYREGIADRDAQQQQLQEQMGTYKPLFDNIVDTIGNYFHIDPETIDVNSPDKDLQRIDNLGIRLAALNYVRKRKMMVQGEPGSGKTSSANIVSTLMSGMPLYVVNKAQIRCHPFVNEEKGIARPDFGELSQGQEITIWQPHVFMNFLVLDELNRLTEGAQNMFLDPLESGNWTYMKSTVITGKRPAYVTINHPDSGNNPIIPPLLDRFDFCMEKRILPWNYQAQKEFCMKAQREFLDGMDVSQEIFTYLDGVNSNTPQSEVKAQLENYAKKFRDQLGKRGIPFMTADDLEGLSALIDEIPFSDDANSFGLTLEREINYSDQYGEKRSSDKPPVEGTVGPDCIDPNHLVSKVKRPLGNRRQSSIRELARWFAFMTGETKVRLEHVECAAPLAINHHMTYDSTFTAKHEGEKRSDMMSMHLAQQLVGDAAKKYAEDIKPFSNAITVLKRLCSNEMTLEDITSNDNLMRDMRKIADQPSPVLRHLQRELHDDLKGQEDILKKLGLYRTEWDQTTPQIAVVKETKDKKKKKK